MNAYACCCWARDPLINPPPPLVNVQAAGGCRAADGRGSFGNPRPAIWSCCCCCCCTGDVALLPSSWALQSAEYLNGEKTFIGVSLCRDPMKMVRRSLENDVRNQSKAKQRMPFNEKSKWGQNLLLLSRFSQRNYSHSGKFVSGSKHKPKTRCGL